MADTKQDQLPVAEPLYDEKVAAQKDTSSQSSIDHYDDGLDTPTEEELHSLRRITGKIPWTAYTVAFVEFCERFSYYGTTAVCMLPSDTQIET